MLAGPHQPLPPALGAGKDALGERGKQPGADQRGLAAPRRSDDRDQGGADQSRHQVRHQPLAAEEVLGVGGVERRQAAERADLGCRRIDRLLEQVEPRPLAGELKVGDAARHLRPGRAQPALIDGGLVRCGFQLLRRLRVRPAARRAVNPKRHPLALGQQRLQRDRHAVGRRV